MKFLARLATGQIALWRTFWLIGTPLALVWDLSGACMVLGFGIEEPFLTGLIITLFTLASLTMPFVAVAIWRSASNYPREVMVANAVRNWRQIMRGVFGIGRRRSACWVSSIWPMTSFRQLSPPIDLLIVSVNGLYGFGFVLLYLQIYSVRAARSIDRDGFLLDDGATNLR